MTPLNMYNHKFASFKIIMNFSRKVLDYLQIFAPWHKMAFGRLNNNKKEAPQKFWLSYTKFAVTME